MAACGYGGNFVYGVQQGTGGTVMTSETPVKRPSGQTVRNCGKWKYSETIEYKDCSVNKTIMVPSKSGGSTDMIDVPTVNYRNKTVNIPYQVPVKKVTCIPQVRTVTKKMRKDRNGRGGGLGGAEGNFGGVIALPPKTLYVDIFYQDKEMKCKEQVVTEMKSGTVRHSYQEPYIKNQKRKFPCYTTKMVPKNIVVKQKCPIVKPTFHYVPDPVPAPAPLPMPMSGGDAMAAGGAMEAMSGGGAMAAMSGGGAMAASGEVSQKGPWQDMPARAASPEVGGMAMSGGAVGGMAMAGGAVGGGVLRSAMASGGGAMRSAMVSGGAVSGGAMRSAGAMRSGAVQFAQSSSGGMQSAMRGAASSMPLSMPAPVMPSGGVRGALMNLPKEMPARVAGPAYPHAM